MREVLGFRCMVDVNLWATVTMAYGVWAQDISYCIILCNNMYYRMDRAHFLVV